MSRKQYATRTTATKFPAGVQETPNPGWGYRRRWPLLKLRKPLRPEYQVALRELYGK